MSTLKLYVIFFLINLLMEAYDAIELCHKDLG